MADPYRWTTPYDRSPNERGEERYGDRQWERDARRHEERNDDRKWTEPRLGRHHVTDWRAPEERGYDRYLADQQRTYGWGAPGGYGRGEARHRSDYDYYGRYNSGGHSARDRAFDEDRSWIDKASDEVQSWFGDREAERRREWDHLAEGQHRGRGPKGYKRTDERVADDVSDRLADDSWLDASDIEVKVENGEVTLSGTVQSRPDKHRAEALAERCSGVSHVQNNLRIAGRLAERPDEIAKMTPLD